MPRQKKDPDVLAAMCERLTVIIDLIGLGDARLSELLGYTTQATIASMRRCQTFVDAERLAKLGKLKMQGEISPNLHWILTGEGDAFISSATDDHTILDRATTLCDLATTRLTNPESLKWKITS